MKIDFKQINRGSVGSNFFIMTVIILGYLVLAVVLIGGLYFLLDYETKRIEDELIIDTKMPILDKAGLNYFISRQKQRSRLSIPNSELLVTESPVPIKKQ